LLYFQIQTSTTTIDQSKTDDTTSTKLESTFETTPDTITDSLTAVNETVQDVVSNTTDQTSSSQEKEQILTTPQSELYLQDQIQGEQETSSPTISSQVSIDFTKIEFLFINQLQISDNEKAIQRTEFESERTTDEEVQDSVSYKTNEIASDTNQVLIDTIRDLINDTINQVISDFNQNIIQNEPINHEITSSDSDLTSPITVLNVEDRSQSSQSTINQDTITNEEDIPDNQTSISDMTWTDLVDEKSSDEKQTTEDKTAIAPQVKKIIFNS
jgi:hypothetical protein